MRIQCPSCSGQFDVPESSAGQVVSCSSCGEQMQVPAAQPAESAPASEVKADAEPTKRCVFCGETILAVARKCKHCKEDIPEGGDAESVRKRLEAKVRAVTEKPIVAERDISYSAGGKFRISTIVVTIICILSVIGIFLGASGKGDGMEAVIVISVISLILFGIAFLVLGITDLTIPSRVGRTTPARGLSAFLKSIKIGRFQYAYACVLDGDKDDLTRTRKARDAVRIEGGSFSFGALDGFKKYWTGIARSGGGQSRQMIISKIKTIREEGDFALVNAEVKVQSYPSAIIFTVLITILLTAVLIAVLTKRETLQVTKLMRRVDGQWYVVNGELESPEDMDFAMAREIDGQ